MQSERDACNAYKTIYQKEYCPIEQRNKDGKYSAMFNWYPCNRSLTSVYIWLVFIFPDDSYAADKVFKKIVRDKGCEKCFKHCALKNKNPPQPENPKRRISEYMDTTSRIGELIIKHRLHDHRKCGKKGTRCQHIFLID